MRFHKTAVVGAWRISLNLIEDERGFFARCYCAREFANHGITDRFVQANISRNIRRGTLRGMHYQAIERPEAKVVRCLRGVIHDVIIDLRRDSPSYLRSVAYQLSDDNQDALYVPAGCGHGFLTLADDCDVYYLMGDFFTPEAARGVRWNDPAFAIDWPEEPVVVSERDRNYPDYHP